MSDGCYICRPDDPRAPEQACSACHDAWWATLAAVAKAAASDHSVKGQSDGS